MPGGALGPIRPEDSTYIDTPEADKRSSIIAREILNKYDLKYRYRKVIIWGTIILIALVVFVGFLLSGSIQNPFF